MIWAVAARKASPGATTLAALLAQLWPGPDRRLLLEADPDGGALAARWHADLGVTHDPGLLSLAASRDGDVADRASLHSQPVTQLVDLIAAPPGPAQVVASLRALGEDAPRAAARDPRTWVVDCGRLGPSSPSLPWARQAVGALLVVRPRLDEVVALRPVAESLRSLDVTAGVVCVGATPFHPLEVAEQVGLPLLGVVADDRSGAELVEHGLDGRALVRSRLARSVAELACSLADTAGDRVEAQDDESEAPARAVGARRPWRPRRARVVPRADEPMGADGDAVLVTDGDR